MYYTEIDAHRKLSHLAVTPHEEKIIGRHRINNDRKSIKETLSLTMASMARRRF